MNYNAELSFLCDTFKKINVQTAIAELARPLSQYTSAILYPLLLQQLDDRPLSEYMKGLTPNCVYTVMDWLGCNHIYFLLPELQPDAILVIGPYLTEPVTTEKIMEQAELHQIDAREHRRLEQYLTSLPVLPKSSHLHLILSTFFDRIWGVGNYSKESVSRDLPQDPAWLLPAFRSEEENIMMDMALMEERYAHENGLIDAVRQGQTWRIDQLMSRITPHVFEKRVADPVRNLKNYCIITNTLLRKAAEQGGVHPIYIDSLSSSFAQRIELLTSPSVGPAMIVEMAESYCRLVRHHATRQYSAPVQKTMIIIDGDLSAQLSLSQLAGQLNVNSSYLSSLFKKETGSTITDYVTSRRIGHARHLLENTRLQIQTVAQLCGFEDVHYFSKIFKKVAGQTPKQYRQQIIEK